jgi:glycosyltransferase involved in cell wall biosynthesis
LAKALKVLMLIENACWPGDQRVKNESAALREKGFQVSIICPKMSSGSQHQESYLCVDNIHVYRYSLPRTTNTTNKHTAYIIEYVFALLVTFWLSLRVLFRHGFDVIHAANPPDLFFTIGLFYRLLGKKFIFDQHDLAPELFKVKFDNRMKLLQKFQLFFERCSYRTADLVIVTNFSQKEKAIERGGCSADKVVVVRNGPDLERIKLVPPEPELKRGRRYLLAYEGEMAVQDGVDYTLYALDRLIHKCGRQDVTLVLMGDGQNASKLRVLAHELQLDEYVHFTGWVKSDDLVRYLATADIGLVPDPQNGLNEFSTLVKTMEYMAMEQPIVAFDLQETHFSARESALYATPNIVEEFADKIEVLLDDEELRARMGAIGHQRVIEELSWDNTKKNLWLAYKMLFKMRQDPLELLYSQEGTQKHTHNVTPNEKA